MNRQNERIVFKAQDYTGVMQDKYPPGRITAASREPATATVVADLTPRVNKNSERLQNIYPFPVDNRPKHHGSETRQTVQIGSRVRLHIKSEVTRIAKLKGWTESKTIADLLEQALASNLAEGFAVKLTTALREAVTAQMQKENNRAGNLALEAFYSAEEARLTTVYLLRLILGSDIDVLPQIIKDVQDQARENVSMALHTRGEQN